MEKDLTQLEILHLPETYNLTDGHAHRRLNHSEQKIANKMAAIFDTTEREQQPELEKEYVLAFYDLNYDKTHYLCMPTASASLELVGNYLRLAGLDAALIEPCFDGLANIFKRHDIALESIPDDWLGKSPADFRASLQTLRSKAICIVSPNNPTGNAYDEANFKELVAFCQEEHRLLILDTTFRTYKDEAHIFDEYALLQASDIDYIVIEDTGKTWPTKELKVSVLAMNSRIFKTVYDIYSDFIYHHSPFTIRLVTEFIKNSKRDNLASVKDVVCANRKALYDAVQDTVLMPCEKSFASVSWLRITSGQSAQTIVDAFAARACSCCRVRTFSGVAPMPHAAMNMSGSRLFATHRPLPARQQLYEKC